MVKQLTDNQRGDLLELIVKKIYKDEGYEIERARRITQFLGGKYISRKVDFFTCDLICIHPTRKPAFIQITTDGGHYADKMKKMISHTWNLNSTEVLFFKYRLTKDKKKPSGFEVSILHPSDGGHPEAWFEISTYLSVRPDHFFDMVDKFIRKKAIPVQSACEFLDWDAKDYAARRKTKKGYKKPEEGTNESIPIKPRDAYTNEDAMADAFFGDVFGLHRVKKDGQ